MTLSLALLSSSTTRVRSQLPFQSQALKFVERHCVNTMRCWHCEKDVPKTIYCILCSNFLFVPKKERLKSSSSHAAATENPVRHRGCTSSKFKVRLILYEDCEGSYTKDHWSVDCIEGVVVPDKLQPRPRTPVRRHRIVRRNHVDGFRRRAVPRSHTRSAPQPEMNMSPDVPAVTAPAFISGYCMDVDRARETIGARRKRANSGEDFHRCSSRRKYGSVALLPEDLDRHWSTIVKSSTM